MGDLKELLEAADSGAIKLARDQGAESLKTIKPFLDRDDSEQRFLAIECLVAVSGEEVPPLLLRCVLDDEREVRGEAANALLENLPSGKAHEVAVAFDASKDPRVRQRLALVLGRLNTPQARSELASRLKGFDQVYDGLVAAAARQGDHESRVRLARLLAQARGERIQDALNLWTYVEDPGLLHQLRPLLDRMEVALEVVTHIKSFSRRGCDLAIDLVLEHLPKQFIFDAKPGEHYPPHEVNLVRDFLDTIQPKPEPEPVDDE